MPSAMELIDLFRRNFPYVVRSDATVARLLSDANNRVFERRDERGRLIAASVARGSAILLICVDAIHRRRGIGSALLAETEEWLRAQGHARATLGLGDDYLMPGVPTNIKPWPEELAPDALYPELNNDAWSFFVRRGYSHSWKDCNCFDMRLSLEQDQEITPTKDAGLPCKARNRGAGVLEVRQADGDAALRGKTSQALVGFSGIALGQHRTMLRHAGGCFSAIWALFPNL